MSERRFCKIANRGCVAPAGYGVNGAYFEGDTSCRGTCSFCGEPVCSNRECSLIVAMPISPPNKKPRRRRACADCLLERFNRQANEPQRIT